MGSENKGDHWPPEETPTMAVHNHHRRSQSPPPPEQHPQSAKLLTLPTVLTIGRVAAIPLLVGTFYMDGWWGTTSTTSIFIVAAITDWLDGYIARKMRLGSAFGAFLDPVADKLMVAATLVLLCTRPFDVAMFGQVSWLLTVPAIAIIGREDFFEMLDTMLLDWLVYVALSTISCGSELVSSHVLVGEYEVMITMSAVREWAASQNGRLSEAVAVNNLGKWKTATQMTALTILLATRDSRGSHFSSFWCCFALYLGMACCVVTSGVYEEDMESVAEVAMVAFQFGKLVGLKTNLGGCWIFNAVVDST
ncbi:unnamed protein product [Camellia sinensis]